MHFSALLLVALVTLVTHVTSTVVSPLSKRAPAVQVSITEVDIGVVKAGVKNIMDSPLKLLTYGSLLDEAPVYKLNISSVAGGSTLPFQGIVRMIDARNLPEEAFQTIEPGAVFEIEIDAAATHEFGSGDYYVVAEGALPYALPSSTQLVDDLIPYKSNVLKLKVEDDQAGNALRALTSPSLVPGRVVQDSCTSEQAATIRKARENCSQRALATLLGGSNKNLYKTLFKENDPVNRFKNNDVYPVIADMASHCSIQPTPDETFHCTDIFRYCQASTIAYTMLVQGPTFNTVVVPCAPFWALPDFDHTCSHTLDQARVLANEAAHLSVQYGTDAIRDLAYGYTASVAINGHFSHLNADSYALFAQGEFFFVSQVFTLMGGGDVGTE
ncbi:deuterolysin metalloprotease [Phlyctema vagabunda]|uniref:deuterolysin n=1 Tax=Phlyctema vagabunda TaxID=108571 RepID=A0ABR4PL69_9HELO